MQLLVRRSREYLDVLCVSLFCVFNQSEDRWLIHWKFATCNVGMFYEMGRGRRTAGSPTEEVWAQKAERQWRVWAQLIIHPECMAAKGQFTLSRTSASLPAAGWQMGTGTSFLYPPTVRVSGGNAGSAEEDDHKLPETLAKHCGLANGQWGKIHTFYTFHVVHTVQGELLLHRWRMQHTESCSLCPAACP